MFGTELCVVVLNMNTGREELFHPKTTPNIPVRMAVRMSISVPGWYCSTLTAIRVHVFSQMVLTIVSLLF